MIEKIEEVLRFWFGDLEHGFPRNDRATLWWGAREETDVLIEELFGARVREALRGELDHWDMTPRGRLALIILLDQFTRMLHRSTPQAFCGDVRALHLAVEGVTLGHDRALEFSERQFFYMPLEHSEERIHQEQSVRCFEQLLREVPPHRKIDAQNALDFACQHRDQILRFGRFPHRNVILGRDSTSDELAFLNQNMVSWGQ